MKRGVNEGEVYTGSIRNDVRIVSRFQTFILRVDAILVLYKHFLNLFFVKSFNAPP